MKDKIKEILDYLGNDKNYNCDCNDGSYYLELPYREAHELKDYITNLQEENERLLVELNQNMIERNNYLSRNEKAIARIKEGIFSDEGVICVEDSEDLLNILQGEDKDVKD